MSKQTKEEKAARAKRRRILRAGGWFMDVPASQVPWTPEQIKRGERHLTVLLPFVSENNPEVLSVLVPAEKKPRRIPMKKTKDNNQPTMMLGEAAIPAATHQPTATIVNGLATVSTRAERLKAAWKLDLLAVDNMARADIAHVTAVGAFESSSLTLGKILLEILGTGKHGEYTAFVKTHIGDSETITNRCDYCLRVAKKVTGYVKPVPTVDPVEERRLAAQAKYEALEAEKSKIDEAAINAAVEKMAQGKPFFDKVACAKGMRLKLEMKVEKKVARARESLESIRLKAEMNKATTEAKFEIRADRGTLDSEMDAIVVKLKMLVKAAAEDKQPKLDFSGHADSIKADVDKLAADATGVVTKRVAYGMAFAPNATTPSASKVA
jgi:hypothetical protein